MGFGHFLCDVYGLKTEIRRWVLLPLLLPEQKQRPEQCNAEFVNYYVSSKGQTDEHPTTNVIYYVLYPNQYFSSTTNSLILTKLIISSAESSSAQVGLFATEYLQSFPHKLSISFLRAPKSPPLLLSSPMSRRSTPTLAARRPMEEKPKFRNGTIIGICGIQSFSARPNTRKPRDISSSFATDNII